MIFIRYGCAFLILAAILFGTIGRSAGFFIHDIYWFQEGLGGDKATHFLMGLSMVFAAWLCWPKMAKYKLLLIVIMLLSIEEASQFFQRMREFSFSDLAYGLAGAFVCFLILEGYSFLLGLLRQEKSRLVVQRDET